MRECFSLQHVPISVLKKFNIKLKPIVTLHGPNNKVIVKVTFANNGIVYICTGWNGFLKINNVRLRDKCLIEFVVDNRKICEEMHVQVLT